MLYVFEDSFNELEQLLPNGLVLFKIQIWENPYLNFELVE